MSEKGSKRNQILLVEDNLSHHALILECIKRVGIREAVLHFGSGEETLQHLARVSAQIAEGASTSIRLALVDIRLPGIDGFEILRTIKSDPLLKQIPVAILSTSNSSQDRSRSIKTGAEEHFVKPLGFNEMCDVFREIQERWLS